jgi:hypothetical protein
VVEDTRSLLSADRYIDIPTMQQILKSVSAHKYAGPFLRPVSYEDAPEYDSVIKRRMDLSTIAKKLQDGVRTFF